MDIEVKKSGHVGTAQFKRQLRAWICSNSTAEQVHTYIMHSLNHVFIRTISK